MRIAIAGYGAEGKVSYDYWRAAGHDVVIADEREQLAVPEAAATQLGEGVFRRLNGFDMVVRTAGLAPQKIHTAGVVWSATNEFFEKCPAPIIGVTGTKGKGTTSSLIASILKAAGRRVHLVGNIGTPALSILPEIQPDDVVVYELSSFQLWDLKRSPHIAVVLAIEPDHLDVHSSVDEYVAAKSAIARHQRAEDVLFFHPTNQRSKDISSLSPACTKARYNCADDTESVYHDSHHFLYQGKTICSVAALQLPGLHNVENACAAVSVAIQLGVEPSSIEAGLRDFSGLDHRLKLVAERSGVRYFDDSIATTPGSAIAALRSFTAPKIIILGGRSKGASYDDVVAECKHAATRVVAIGETAAEIAAACQRQGVECLRVDGDMETIVAAVKRMATAGDVVILSPASSSFDMFTNYAQRGDAFIAAVTSSVA